VAAASCADVSTRKVSLNMGVAESNMLGSVETMLGGKYMPISRN
jgi:hypothetical protein